MRLEDVPIEGLQEPSSGAMNDFQAWADSFTTPSTGICVVVDDEPNIAKIEAMIMQNVGYRVHVAHNGPETLELVEKHHPDLVLLDFMMPGMNGLEVLQRIKASHPTTYVIIVTGKGSEETAIEVMKAGASDYIIKPLPKLPIVRQIVDRTLRLRDAELKSQLYVRQLRELNLSLEERVRDKTAQLEKQNLVLQDMVIRDDLTGLFNQKALYARLEQEVARATRYNRDLGFIMLDLDHFKLVNDRHGHQVGSAVIQQVASVILTSIRNVDWAARFGGDEFCVVLPETDANGTRAAAERIRHNISENNFCVGGLYLRARASLGTSMFESGSSVENLIKRADVALYRSKAAGRNRVEADSKG